MNNVEENKYILQWKDCALKAAKALNEKNWQLFDELMSKANEYYEQYKEDIQVADEYSNFGVYNEMFENALPLLFKENKKMVKKFISTIKEDKNLLNQFKFIKSLEKYSNELDAVSYINEALSLFHSNVDIKTIDKSNAKLYSILESNGIKIDKSVIKDKAHLFETCDYLFKNKKKMTNLSDVNLKIKDLSESIVKSNKKVNENKKDSFKLIDEFETKYGSLLNEQEKDFIKEIFNNNSKDAKKEKLFNSLKNECLNIINTMIKESSEDEQYGLNAIKEQISSKEFCNESLVQDIAKLLEIRDILKDK